MSCYVERAIKQCIKPTKYHSSVQFGKKMQNPFMKHHFSPISLFIFYLFNVLKSFHHLFHFYLFISFH